MKRLLVVLLLSLSLGLAAHRDAKAYFDIDYLDGNWSEVYELGGGNLVFVFFNWQGTTDLDIFTMHSSGSGTPIGFSIGGAAPGMGYYFNYLYYYAGYYNYDGYYTNNYGVSWSYAGTFYY